MRSKTDFTKGLIILIISFVVNYIFILISNKATELDLGQIAYTMSIFFPISAFVIGVLSEVLLRRLWYAPIIAVSSFTISIVVKYNIKGLVYVLAYAILSVIGFYVAFGIRVLAKKLRENR